MKATRPKIRYFSTDIPIELFGNDYAKPLLKFYVKNVDYYKIIACRTRKSKKGHGYLFVKLKVEKLQNNKSYYKPK